ncbi:MAG: HTTM domain-containing protein [Verrucomicrobiia bacterium]
MKPVSLAWTEAWSIPTESLGLWRLATGLVLLAEWRDRILQLDPLYLHEGLRRTGDLMRLVEGWTGPWPGWAVVALASLGLVAATAWTVGWLTRWAQGLALGTFALFANLNLMTGHAGDVFLIGIIFWTLPLPCGASFSLDQWRGAKSTRWPGADLAALGQLALVYALAGLAKTGEGWRTGEALARALGGSLGSATGISTVETLPAWTLALVGKILPGLELLLALLILCPWFRPWPRRLALGLAAALQLGLVLLMDLGLLPWAMLAACLLLIQREDWGIWPQRPAWAPSDRHLSEPVRGPGVVWLALFFLAAAVSADTTLHRTWRWDGRLAPTWLWQPLHLAQLHQDWGMFAPDVRPFRTDFRLEVEGTCGTLWTFGDRTGSFLGASGKGWRKYIEQAAHPKRETERNHLLALAARYAARHGIEVRRVRLVRVTMPIGSTAQSRDPGETVVGELAFTPHRPPTD